MRKIVTTIMIIILVGIIGIRIGKQSRQEIEKEEIKNNVVAIMVATDETNENYTNYAESKWPKRGYKFNAELTRCVGENGLEKGKIKYNIRSREAEVVSKGVTYCYLYFDVDAEGPEFDGSGIGNGGFVVANGPKCTMTNSKCTYERGVSTTLKWKSEDVEAYCVSNSSNPDDCSESDWKPVGEGVYSATYAHTLTAGDEEKIVYAHLRDLAENVTTVSDKIILDGTVPQAKIEGQRQSNSEGVASGTWINERMKFIITNTLTGPSGYTIYYCEGDSNCNPTTRITSGQQRLSSSKNTYYVRYKVVSGAGLESSINTYTARVDIDAPTISITNSGSTAYVTCNDGVGSGVRSGNKSVTLTTSGQVVSGTCVDNVGHQRSSSRPFYYGVNRNACGQTYHPRSCCCESYTYDCSQTVPSNVYSMQKVQAGSYNRCSTSSYRTMVYNGARCPSGCSRGTCGGVGGAEYCECFCSSKNCSGCSGGYEQSGDYCIRYNYVCPSNTVQVGSACVYCPSGWNIHNTNQCRKPQTCTGSRNYDCSYYTDNSCWYGG